MSTSRVRCLLILVVVSLMLISCQDSSVGVYPGAETGDASKGFEVLIGQFVSLQGSADYEKMFGPGRVSVDIENADQGEWELVDSYVTEDSVADVRAWYDEQLSGRWDRYSYPNSRGGGYIFAQSRKQIILVSSDVQGDTWILSIARK